MSYRSIARDRPVARRDKRPSHMFGALAEFERSLIRERTQAGLAAALRVGRTSGRPPKLTEDDLEVAKRYLEIAALAFC